MKKINWSYIVTIVLLIAATLIGAYLMEEEWIESMTAWIWIIGELCITLVWMTKEILKWCEKYLVNFFKD